MEHQRPNNAPDGDSTNAAPEDEPGTRNPVTRRTFVQGTVAGAAVLAGGRIGQALAADPGIDEKNKVAAVLFEVGTAETKSVVPLLPATLTTASLSWRGPLPQGVRFDGAGKRLMYDGKGPAEWMKGHIVAAAGPSNRAVPTIVMVTTAAAVAAPSATQAGWSFKQHAAGYSPYSTGSKHTTVLYDPVNAVIIQCGGDFNGGPEKAPNGATWTQGATRRDMWAADVRNKTTLTWTKVQPMFMPAGQVQGPFLGPDQVWFWRRTAVNPPEIWVGPGFYRAHVSAAPFVPYEGEPYVAFKWKRPGWERPATQRLKVPQNYSVSDPAKVFKRQFGDGNVPDKFCAYDPVTDAAYCINDNWEIIKWDHARNDWDHAPSGDGYANLHSSAVDDQGRSLGGAAEVSIGGSHQACVGRRIYALCKWRNRGNTDVRSYLAWFDIDTEKVGAITCPFDIDRNWPTVPGWGNPEEHANLCALNGRLVVALTYHGAHAGHPEQWWRDLSHPQQAYKVGDRPLWWYDVAAATWTQGDPIPEDIYGNTMVAVPDQNAVYLMGSTANPANSDGGWNKAAVYTLPQAAQLAAPPPASGRSTATGVLTYSQTRSGPERTFASFHDLVVDAAGQPVWGGPNTHAAYSRGENGIWRYDPVRDTVETLYADNGNRQGWVGTDNFVRFVIPGYNWFLQNFTVLFDLDAKKIIASNVASAKKASGINDGDTTPGWDDVFVAEGKLALGGSSKPYMAPHDWCESLDVGIMLGGLHTPEYATLIWKNPDYPSKSTKPLGIKCVAMPFSSRHPDALTFVNRGQSNARCRGEWLYVFGANYQSKGSGIKAMRLHVPTFMATPPDARVPDSACEFLPDMQYVFPNGVGYVGANGVTYDSDRDRFLIFNYEVLEFDPTAKVYAKVTPNGFPKGLSGVNCAYDRVRKIHWLMGGELASMAPTLALPAPPLSPPFSNGTPTYAIRGRFNRIQYT